MVKTAELLKRSPDIEMMQKYFSKVNAIVEGLDAIREGSTDFLPKFPNENGVDYDYRLSLSKFTNIYRDVLEGLATKPFQNEVSIIDKETPSFINEFVEDVDGSGNNLTNFASLTFFNGINYAIDWIFVDYPNVDKSKELNQSEAKKMNIRPFWSHILAKNVLDVRTEIVGAKEVITYFKILEPSFSGEPRRVREFQFDEDKNVIWKLYKEVLKSKVEEKEFIVEDRGQLTIDVIPIVPFITGRRDGKTFKFYPAMEDAADLQINLYQDETALQYIKNLACYPMLAANNMTPKKGADGQPMKVAIGPGRVLYGVPDGNGGNGEWKYIEPQANSMEFLQKSIDKTKQDLRELGRQPLTALSTQLTTTTTSIAAGKGKSAVTTWALSLKDTLENCLILTCKWQNIDYKPEVNVYTGFDDITDDLLNIDSLNKARERGDISLETTLEELKRRGVLSPEFTYEREMKRLLDEIPSDKEEENLTDEDENLTDEDENLTDNTERN